MFVITNLKGFVKYFNDILLVYKTLQVFIFV
jgi:hypothetical protein